MATYCSRCDKLWPFGEQSHESRVLRTVGDTTSGHKDPRLYWFCPSSAHVGEKLPQVNAMFLKMAEQHPERSREWLDRSRRLCELFANVDQKEGCWDKFQQEKIDQQAIEEVVN